MKLLVSRSDIPADERWHRVAVAVRPNATTVWLDDQTGRHIMSDPDNQDDGSDPTPDLDNPEDDGTDTP